MCVCVCVCCTTHIVHVIVCESVFIYLLFVCMCALINPLPTRNGVARGDGKR